MLMMMCVDDDDNNGAPCRYGPDHDAAVIGLLLVIVLSNYT